MTSNIKQTAAIHTISNLVITTIGTLTQQGILAYMEIITTLVQSGIQPLIKMEICAGQIQTEIFGITIRNQGRI